MTAAPNTVVESDPTPRYQVDKHGELEHPADLYQPGGNVDMLPSLDAVDDQQVEFYGEHGYLAVEAALDPQQVKDALEAIDDLIAGRNQAFNGVVLEAAAARDEASTDADLKDQLDKVRKLAGYVQFDERLNRLAHDPKLLAVVKKLMGREPKLYQDMALLKPPRIGREKPWHQDHAYFNLDLNDRIVGIWIALDEATVDNGCMQLLDQGHKLGPILHWQRRDWQICDTEMQGKRSLACPLKPGGALFFDSLLPHGTPTNFSPMRRRALQFHYAPDDAHHVPTEQRLTIFGPDGKDVTC